MNSMIGFRVDYRNPKYKLGTILKLNRDYNSTTVKNNLFAGSYLKITGFEESVLYPKGTNEYVYVLTKCNRNGFKFKKEYRFNQLSIEFDLCSRLFSEDLDA